MKQKPTLKIAFLITVLFEIILMVLVYNKIGADNLPTQIVRLAIQTTLFLILFEKRSKIILYILTFYHVLIALPLITEFNTIDMTGKSVFIYHLVLTILIFFNVNIDLRLFQQTKSRVDQ